MQQQRFKNKIVLVTGGNSGIGLATATRFASEGARVIITGRDAKTLKSAVKKIGHRAVAIQADATRLPELDAVFREVKKKFRRLDVLYVNHGVTKFLPTAEVTEEMYDSQMDINVKGVFFTVQKALPLLRDGAAVVITGSIASINTGPGQSVYGATKAAVRALARTFSTELVGRGIRVNVVSPGPIDTPIFDRDFGPPKEKIPEIKKFIPTIVPLQRMGRAAEVAAAVAFLASDEASFIAGAELFVDGGITLR